MIAQFARNGEKAARKDVKKSKPQSKPREQVEELKPGQRLIFGKPGSKPLLVGGKGNQKLKIGEEVVEVTSLEELKDPTGPMTSGAVAKKLRFASASAGSKERPKHKERETHNKRKVSRQRAIAAQTFKERKKLQSNPGQFARKTLGASAGAGNDTTVPAATAGLGLSA
jgi:hypothetical protein